MGIGEIVDPRSQLSLPPGFRFFPTDEELLVQYLCRKVAGHHFPLQIIGDVDLYKFDPWDLPSKALFGEKEWYFFSPRDRKYPNGSRPNRVAGSGYWKATGTDKVITTEGRKVGIKKALVFYIGKAPKGTKTNWIMHEYRLFETSRKNGSSKLDDWVLCRIYKKNSNGPSPNTMSGVQSKEYSHDSSSSPSSSSQYEDVLESLPELDVRFFKLPKMENFQVGNDQKLNLQRLNSANFDWATLAGLSAVEFGQAQNGLAQQAHVNVSTSQNDAYAPANGMDEVHSGLGNQRANNSRFFSPNVAGFTQGFSNSFDPFGVRYPTQLGGLGFRQ